MCINAERQKAMSTYLSCWVSCGFLEISQQLFTAINLVFLSVLSGSFRQHLCFESVLSPNRKWDYLNLHAFFAEIAEIKWPGRNSQLIFMLHPIMCHASPWNSSWPSLSRKTLILVYWYLSLFFFLKYNFLVKDLLCSSSTTCQQYNKYENFGSELKQKKVL